jgi:orotidine-5'-phosphate decarboxylase
MHFADRLIDRARSVKSVVCVGIDPRWSLLPEELRARAREVESDPARAVAWSYVELAKAVIEAVAPYAAAVKPQSAFFEAAGPAGADAFARTLELASDAGLVTIADAKRGDIGSTSEAYAQGFFGGLDVDGDTLGGMDADSLTINPYLGTDGVAPFLDACDARGRGVFVLVRTSNPSAAEIQDLVVEGGEGERVFERVAALVRKWGEGRIGNEGWSSVGAVAGATTPEALAEVRALLPQSILLVPGYGAQGGGAADVIGAFDAKGEGAVVNASRSIVFGKPEITTLAELAAAAGEAAKRMRDDIGEALAKR